MTPAAPVSVRVRTFGNSDVDDKEITARVTKAIDFRLGAIVRDLGLQKLPLERNGFYQKLAVYGHMGRIDVDAPWERTDKASALG